MVSAIFFKRPEFRQFRKNEKQNRKIVHMRGILIILTLAGSLLLAKASTPTLASITLGWNPSQTTGVAGYYIYYGTSSGNYTGVVAVPSAGATNVMIRGLTSGATYYFAAASYDSSGNESALSPQISGVAGATTTSTSVAASLTSALMSGGHFGFTVGGSGTGVYIVQASTNLVNWVNVMTNTGGPFNFVDTNASHFSRRFYRTAYQSSN